jgi:hypothetical protein
MADPAGDVQLTDLHVIQEFSLAVRGATAPRAVVIEALEADLAWLRGASPTTQPAEPVAAPVKAARKAAVRPAKKATPRRTEA